MLLEEGKVPDALSVYRAAFQAARAAGDHFAASNLAHMAGVAAPDAMSKLAWNVDALREADAVTDRASVASFYASLYNNLALAYAMVGQVQEARRYLRQAESHLGSLAPGPYADAAAKAIKRAKSELGGDP